MTARAAFLGLGLVLALAGAPRAAERAIEGRWEADIKAGDAPATHATLEFARMGSRLTGVLRSGAGAYPIFDIKETGAEIVFTVVIPGTPYVTVHYMGERIGDALELVGQGDDQAMYGLSAHRDELQRRSEAPAQGAQHLRPEALPALAD